MHVREFQTNEKVNMIRRHIADVFSAALTAADPYHAVRRAVKKEGNRLFAGGAVYDLERFARVIVVGAGKATARMAQAVEEIFGARVAGGVIIVKYGHRLPLRKVRQVEAAHPIPDEAGMGGTREILDLLRQADEKTLVICLLSGGGSALMVAPVNGITLEDTQRTTDLLLKAGARIDELNAVRKHISSVKGGRLVRDAYPATVLTLVLSDVIGDRLDVIASGPTVPDATTFADALGVFEKYDVKTKLPEGVVAYLERGAGGKEPETPKEGDECFRHTSVAVVGGLSRAAEASRQRAEVLGFETKVITTELQGEARSAARRLASVARKATHPAPYKPICLLSGGETTVTVKGSGLGGRNQELALAFALEIEGMKGVTLLSAGTDGTDGPTDAAGAIVDGETATKARKLGMDPAAYLEDNDSYHFFKEFDSRTGERSHLITGPTGTNVMDVQIIMIEGQERTT